MRTLLTRFMLTYLTFQIHLVNVSNPPYNIYKSSI